MSPRLALFNETLGIHPEFYTTWQPSELGWEPPF